MIRNIDHKLRFEAEPKYKGSYCWAIQEVDSEGKLIGRDLIPWELSHNFEMAKLTTQRSFSITDEYPSGGRLIRAELIPAIDYRGNRPSYSMFGTPRRVPTIELYIEEFEPNEKFPEKTARASGFVSYTDDDPIWGGKTAPDHLQFNLYFLSDEFDTIYSQVEQGRVSVGSLRLHAEGIYSEWTPDITTDQFKVLSNNERDQPLEVPSDMELPPKRLGKVWDVSLSLRQYQLMQVDPDQPDDGEFVDVFDDDNLTAAASESATMPKTTVSPDQIQAIQLSLWVIAALLLIGLFV